ncbi:MAG: hypothetical protein RIC95_05930 [Vicingaceae bacterium]
MDYTIFYKKKYENHLDISDRDYDLFISAYNKSERVNEVYKNISANEKHWIVLPEYNFTDVEFPAVDDGELLFIYTNIGDEASVVREYFEENSEKIQGQNICIDMTGFLRPHLMFLVRYLGLMKVGKVDFLYSDPDSYKDREDTTFTSDYIEVRQVIGCEGNHNPETSNDLMIIGAGYDAQRISDVAKNKASARKIQLLGFPSLRPDMYQENILNANKAEEEAGMGKEDSFSDPSTTILAPANDPFVTAQLLSDFVKKENKKVEISNLYLCPLSTKAQTLGFSLFYISECIDKAVSMIFPFCHNYERQTSTGISKVWIYTVEFY